MKPAGRAARSPRLSAELDQALRSRDYLVDPYPIYARLREEAPPVAWSESFRAWLLMRYDDVLWATRDPRLVVSPRMPTLLAQLPEADRVRASPIVDHYAATLAFTDPPRHAVIRALMQKVFAANAIAALGPSIQALVDSYLDAAEMDVFDIVPQLALRLPVDVIGELLGVPSPDRAQFRPWTDDILGIFSTGRVAPDQANAGLASLAEMRTYLLDLIRERALEPRDDLVSWFVEQARPGGTLSRDEILANCVMLYTAGHATTSGLLSNAFLALFRHPEQLRCLRENPRSIETAVEELLRYGTSVQRAWRVAATEIEYQGCVILKGDTVYPLLGSANHDPLRFNQPEELNLGRQNNRQMAFGQGIHFCLGAGLARLEAAIAINAFLRRFPNATHIEEKVAWDDHMGLGSTVSTLVSLPVQLR